MARIWVVRLWKVKAVSFFILCSWTLVWADPVLKDPTQPYRVHTGKSVAFVEKTDFQVTSILKRKNVAWAIINGVKVNVGQRVGGAEVLRIAYDKVLLDMGDSQRWVVLSNNSGLKKSR